MKVSAIVLAICLMTIVNARLVDHDQLAGSYGLRRLSKKIGRSINYRDAQVQSNGRYDQSQTGQGYQQASAISSSSSGSQQPTTALGYQPSPSSGYNNQPKNKQATTTYQTDNPAAGRSPYGKDSNEGSSRSNYDTAKEKGMPYDFSWAVKDEPTSNDYAHQEKSDGQVVTGSYRVLLPDGRTQVVTYRVEGDSGFVAKVTYEGEAKPYVPLATNNAAVSFSSSSASASSGYQQQQGSTSSSAYAPASASTAGHTDYHNQQQQATADGATAGQSASHQGFQSQRSSSYNHQPNTATTTTTTAGIASDWPAQQKPSTNYGQSASSHGDASSIGATASAYDGNRSTGGQPQGSQYGLDVAGHNSYGSSAQGYQQQAAYGGHGVQTPSDSYFPPALPTADGYSAPVTAASLAGSSGYGSNNGQPSASSYGSNGQPSASSYGSNGQPSASSYGSSSIQTSSVSYDHIQPSDSYLPPTTPAAAAAYPPPAGQPDYAGAGQPDYAGAGQQSSSSGYGSSLQTSSPSTYETGQKSVDNYVPPPPPPPPPSTYQQSTAGQGSANYGSSPSQASVASYNQNKPSDSYLPPPAAAAAPTAASSDYAAAGQQAPSSGYGSFSSPPLAISYKQPSQSYTTLAPVPTANFAYSSAASGSSSSGYDTPPGQGSAAAYQPNQPSDSYLPPPPPPLAAPTVGSSNDAAAAGQQAPSTSIDGPLQASTVSYQQPSNSYLPPLPAAGQGSISHYGAKQSSPSGSSQAVAYVEPTNSYLPPPPPLPLATASYSSRTGQGLSNYGHSPQPSSSSGYESQASATPSYEAQNVQKSSDSDLPPTATYQSAGTATHYAAAQQPGYDSTLRSSAQSSADDNKLSGNYAPPTAVFQPSSTSSSGYGATGYPKPISSSPADSYSNRKGSAAETSVVSSGIGEGQLFHGDYRQQQQKVASSTASYGEKNGETASGAKYPAGNALGAANTRPNSRARSAVYSPVGWRLY